MQRNLSIIFLERPKQWGLRGDVYLWDEFEKHFSDFPLTFSKEAFIKEFKDQFEVLTETKINSSSTIHIQAFSHGGMSSGMVSPEFWLEKALPLLINRLEKLDHE